MFRFFPETVRTFVYPRSVETRRYINNHQRLCTLEIDPTKPIYHVQPLCLCYSTHIQLFLFHEFNSRPKRRQLLFMRCIPKHPAPLFESMLVTAHLLKVLSLPPYSIFMIAVLSETCLQTSFTKFAVSHKHLNTLRT